MRRSAICSKDALQGRFSCSCLHFTCHTNACHPRQGRIAGAPGCEVASSRVALRLKSSMSSAGQGAPSSSAGPGKQGHNCAQASREDRVQAISRASSSWGDMRPVGSLNRAKEQLQKAPGPSGRKARCAAQKDILNLGRKHGRAACNHTLTSAGGRNHQRRLVGRRSTLPGPGHQQVPAVQHPLPVLLQPGHAAALSACPAAGHQLSEYSTSEYSTSEYSGPANEICEQACPAAFPSARGRVCSVYHPPQALLLLPQWGQPGLAFSGSAPSSDAHVPTSTHT
jgi:hypothetical protein